MAHLFLTSVAVTVAGAFYIKFWKFKSWSRLGLGTVYNSLPFGFANQLIFKKNTSLHHESTLLYNEIKQTQARHGGTYLFTTPIYVPIDPIIIKDVLNSQTVTERNIFHHTTKDQFYNPIYYGQMSETQNLREGICRLQTDVGKSMFLHDLMQVCDKFISNLKINNCTNLYFLEIIKQLNVEIVKDLFMNKTVSETELKQHLKQLSEPENSISVKYLLGLISSSILSLFLTRLSKKKAVNYFENHLMQSINEHGKGKINRFLDLLIENSQENTDSVIEILTILLGNMKSIISTITFSIYEISRNLQIQTKLREEINSVLEENKGNISLETLSKMTYLDQVLKETLRKYPPLPIIKRCSIKSYVVPSSTIHLKENSDVIVSIAGLHYDPDYFPMPEDFNPDRFNKENVANIIEGTYLPYGYGSRGCIGKELSEIQIKLILVLFVSNFEILSQKDDSNFVSNDGNSVSLQPNKLCLNIKTL